MTTIRVLVGTRKSAFILTSDGKRQKWNVATTHIGGSDGLPSFSLFKR